MAEDFRLLALAEAGQGVATFVRLYQWDPPTVSLGRHQIAERAIDPDFCRARGIPQVRRPTGGRAVFHDCELTYAVVTNDPTLTGSGIGDTYRRIAEVLQAACAAVGVDAELARIGLEDSTSPAAPAQKPCFAVPSRYELLVDGRKIAGSAQRRLRKAVLQHGSLPLEIDYERMGGVLGFPPSALRSRMISIREAAGRPVPFPELIRAMESAFARLLPSTGPVGPGGNDEGDWTREALSEFQASRKGSINEIERTARGSTGPSRSGPNPA